MTAKESKAVAWQERFRDIHGQWMPWYACSEYRYSRYANATESDGDWEARALIAESVLHAAEAELGELRRRVGEIAGGIAIYAGDEEGSRLDRLASHWEKQLRQLLASDGGADGEPG